MNVIVVDWSHGSNTWNYLKAAVNTKVVGKQIALWVTYKYNKLILFSFLFENT